jgi:hypothetical protein
VGRRLTNAYVPDVSLTAPPRRADNGTNVGARFGSLLLSCSIALVSCFESGLEDDAMIAYDRCRTNHDCVGTTTNECIEIAFDNAGMIASDMMCSTQCNEGGACPVDGLCATIGAGPAVCFRRCTADDECPMGWNCTSVVTGSPICLP